MDLLLALVIIVVASIFIMYACNGFDDASSYLGRNMAPGVKGATINAIGSSMPELMTAMFLLFLFADQDGFAAGIATTAGSAIFNAVVIPAVCIFAVRFKGIPSSPGSIVREKVKEIFITKSSVLRDGFFLLIAEAALILFLGNNIMTWWMGAAMIGIYGIYFLFLARGFGVGDDDGEDEDDDDDDDDESPSFIKALLTCDFNNLLYGGRAFNTASAWVVLSLATLVIAIACYGLAEAVMLSAAALDVPPYFTALVFAAAATSVPDTILSVKDAMRGSYDDAIGNAVGSNTFDITVALGLPLLLYALIYGDVTVGSAAETQTLRIVLFGVTVVVLALLLLTRRVTVTTGIILAAIYCGWMGYVVYSVVVAKDDTSMAVTSAFGWLLGA
jgi:cation:H+ antiporter